MLKPVWNFVLLCCTAGAALPAGAQEVADHVSMGAAANEAHDPATAIQHFQAALDQDSSNYEANWRGALTLLDLGDLIPDSVQGNARDSLYALAERFAARAVKSDSMGADGHFALAASLGKVALTLGQDAQIRQAAIIRREALRAIELNPKHDGAYHIMGRWNAEIMGISGIGRFVARRFLGAGIFKEASWKNALSYMQKAVELDPGRIYHRLELALIYADRKRGAEAETQLYAVESLPIREVLDSIYKRQGAELRRRLAKR